MGTAKVTESGAFFDIEDANGDIHTHVTLKEAAELLDVTEVEIKEAIAEGMGGVGYVEVDDEEEEDFGEEGVEDEDEEEDK